MQGRKPYPFQVMKATNKKNKISNKTLDSRAEHEPTINSNKLTCPIHLPPEVKIEWQRIVKLYREFKMPIITDLDVNALEIYCEALVRYRKAIAKVAESSEVVMIDGSPKVNPWQRVADNAADQVKKYGEILLLDPVSRARASLAKNDDKPDPLKDKGFGNV